MDRQIHGLEEWGYPDPHALVVFMWWDGWVRCCDGEGALIPLLEFYVCNPLRAEMMPGGTMLPSNNALSRNLDTLWRHVSHRTLFNLPGIWGTSISTPSSRERFFAYAVAPDDQCFQAALANNR